jgi:hypothetical protein
MPLDSATKEEFYTLRYLVTKEWQPKTPEETASRKEALKILDGLLGPRPGDVAVDASDEPSAPASWLYTGEDFPIVGVPMMPTQIAPYFASCSPKWAKGITIHHMAAPSLAQRPQGLLTQHMLNLRSFYRDSKGWSSGPHFFLDEDQIWPFTPANFRGVHAKSFNSAYLGLEMLGDYDSEDPWSGRGLKVLTMTATTVAAILKATGWPIERINFHRDDPKTTKTCPGTLIPKSRFLDLVRSKM